MNMCMEKLGDKKLRDVLIGYVLGKRSVAVSVLGLLLLAACGQTPVRSDVPPPNVKQGAMARWKAHCENSGEFIREVVDGVDGIFLINIRTQLNVGDQYVLDDPYGSDLTNNGYLISFLRGSYDYARKTPRTTPGWPPHLGFRFVEAKDPKDGILYRYTGEIVEPWQRDKRFLKGDLKFELKRVPIASPSAQYGVRFDDISTREDRDNWIAGSSLKVIDLRSGKVIAERIGYMIDSAQGSNVGGRTSWLFAADNACPDFERDFPEPLSNPPYKSRRQAYQTLRFVEKVLKPLP